MKLTCSSNEVGGALVAMATDGTEPPLRQLFIPMRLPQKVFVQAFISCTDSKDPVILH